MILEELRDRLWQCSYSEDREAFDLWAMGNIQSLLKQCIELEENHEKQEDLNREIGKLEDKLYDAQNGIDNLEDEVSCLQDRIEELENQISSSVDNCDSDGVA